MSETDSDIEELAFEVNTPKVSGFKRRRNIRVQPSEDSVSFSTKKIKIKDLEASGKIKRIVLKNFLCHEHLDYIPSEKINLIQGSNGSGKSSIVAAIIAGLGGASRMTDRGSLKNLIMWNKSSASVEIHLDNSGFPKYKRELYGNVIIIERRILPSSSTYKLKSSTGQVLSQKKEELTRLLEFFDLFVDNPIVVLTQEKAKTFLNSSNPRDLFKFFMLSTTMQQLKDDYNRLEFDCESSRSLIISKKESLSTQRKVVNALENKLMILNNLAQKRQKLIDLRSEKEWAEISELEIKLDHEKKKQSKMEMHLEKCKEELKKMNDKKKEYSADHKQSEEKLSALVSTELPRLQTLVDEASHELKQAKANHAKNNYELKNMDQEYRAHLDDVNVLKKKLETDYSEAHLKYEEEIKKLQTEKTNLKHQIQNVQQCLETEETHYSNLPRTNDMENNLKIQKDEHKALQTYLKNLGDELHSLSSGRDPYLVFGPQMPQIVRKIEMEWQNGNFSCKPIGPLGSYIKVTDSNWIHIAELVLGNLLTSFLVNNKQDLIHLKNIFSHFFKKGDSLPSITISKFRNNLHDVSRFQVCSTHYFSLWSIIEVSDIQVANALIDQRQVESILLVPTAQEAGNILKDARTVPRNCQRAYTMHGDLFFPDPNYRVYSGDGRKQLQYLEVSVEAKKIDLQNRIQTTRKELSEFTVENSRLTKELQQLEQCHKESQGKISKLRATMDKLRSKYVELENGDINAPPDVYQLKKELDETKALLAEVTQRRNKIKDLYEESKKKLSNANSHLVELHSQRSKLNEEGQELEVELNNKQDSITDIQKKILVYSNKKKEIEAQMKEDVGQKMDVLEAKIKEKLVPLQGKERIRTRKRVEAIEREYNTLEATIESQEREYGDVEEITRTWQDKKNSYEKIRDELLEQYNYISKLREIINSRINKFEHFKNFSSVFLKEAFEKKMKNHSLKGKIEISYEKEVLKILAIKDGANSEKVHQSLAMMSGGERSFSTVCFISALWDIIYSPVRILDEFDIFMDIVLRKKAVEMLMNCVNNNHQYHLVSPLEYNLSTTKAACFRVPSPERKKRKSNAINP